MHNIIPNVSYAVPSKNFSTGIYFDIPGKKQWPTKKWKSWNIQISAKLRIWI